MADLDDFFAKKDKKKKGKGKKYAGTSPAVMAKALEVSLDEVKCLAVYAAPIASLRVILN